MSNAPVIPRIMKSTNVSIPKNPSGLTNLLGNVNFIPMNIVLSTPSYTHLRKRVKLFYLGNTLLGGACSEAGPANALPVRGSYMLPWHGHSPLFLPSCGQYFQRHQR